MIAVPSLSAGGWERGESLMPGGKLLGLGIICTLRLLPLSPQLVPYGIGKSLMPGKKLLGGYFGTPKKEDIVEMQEKFEKLLRAVLREFPVPPTPLLKFLGYPFTVSHSILWFKWGRGRGVVTSVHTYVHYYM